MFYISTKNKQESILISESSVKKNHLYYFINQPCKFMLHIYIFWNLIYLCLTTYHFCETIRTVCIEIGVLNFKGLKFTLITNPLNKRIWRVVWKMAKKYFAEIDEYITSLKECNLLSEVQVKFLCEKVAVWKWYRSFHNQKGNILK